MSQQTDLSKYNNDWYQPGSPVKRVLWYFVNGAIMLNPMNPFSGLRKFSLRLFGAKIGTDVVVKPRVNVKYPWKLTIGDHVWIGEQVWIDNLDEVVIGNHVCLSQGAMLLCGNHNYKKVTFDLMIGPIRLEDGVWIGAQTTVCPGVTCKSHAVLSVGSVANKDLEAYGIYSGIPAEKIKDRVVEA